MISLLKSLILATTPALLVVPALAAEVAVPATQPSTTQPATQPLANSNDPMVIPDGTSRENPGPVFINPNRQNGLNIYGMRN